MIDRNRRDSLQLLRIQNDLNSLGLGLRDMLDPSQPYPLKAWSAQFRRVQGDLNDALRLQENLSVAHRTPEQRQYLEDSLAQFWVASDRTFALASEGKEKEARDEIRASLQPRVAALSTAVARLLVANNESEQQAGERIERIYDGVQRQVYLFLVATLIAIVLTSVYLIRLTRRLFAHISHLSEQRSELAQKLIATQESTLLHISRELHDEFGQILTAVGSMLRRAGKLVPEGSPLRSDLQEVSEIAQSALDKVRSLSQALHPVTLEEAGLDSTIDWYLPDGRTAERNRHTLRQGGDALSGREQCRHSHLSSAAGSAEQCCPSFRNQGGMGSSAVQARPIGAGSGRPRQLAFGQTGERASVWSQCGSAPNW